MASQETPEWSKPSLYPTVDIPSNIEDTAFSKVVHLQPPSPRAPGILTIGSIRLYGLEFPDQGRGSGHTGSGALTVQNKWQIYAILEYEAFQERIEGFLWHVSGRVWWSRPDRSLDFDVYRPSELTVHIFLRSSGCSGLKEELQVIPIGTIKYNPFQTTDSLDRNWPNIQDSTVKYRINVSYIEKKGPDPDVWQNWTKEWVVQKNTSYAYITCIRRNSNRQYAMRTLPLVVPDADSDITQNVRSKIQQHPFIAPLQFVFESPQGLSLLSPIPSSGHLSYYLQRERRFELDKVMLYAAELVCVLEHLHGLGIIASLKLENIFLDSFGHICLCNPDIFGLDSNDKDCLLFGTEYPAPELLVGGEISEKVDWWGLGIVLYEMMVGLPPFRHKDADEKRQKTFSQALQIPRGFPPAANDILHRLFQKSPVNRLGANGALELKTHAFFRGVNWQELLQPKRMGPLMPVSVSTHFVPRPKEPKRRTPLVYDGVDFEELQATMMASWNLGRKRVNVYDDVALDAYRHGWELVWDHNIRQFHFKNRLTDEKRPVGLQGPSYTTVEAEQAPGTASVSEGNPTVPEDNDEAISRRPSVDQKRDALTAALKAGYNSRVVSQILTYNIDLNNAILQYDHNRDSMIDAIRVTPLEWAVEHEQLDLVNMFLDNGADANHTYCVSTGPSLRRAVRKKNQEIIVALLKKTNRIFSTRALCSAIEMQDTKTVGTLLTNGVCCEFERSDFMPLKPPSILGCKSRKPIFAPFQLAPPIVRATVLGNADLVRMLLSHGADANAGYHYLCVCMDGGESEMLIPAVFSCGTVIQLAMERKNTKIVELLLDSGADTTHPRSEIWDPHHVCPMISRPEYVELIASLEDFVAARA